MRYTKTPKEFYDYIDKWIDSVNVGISKGSGVTSELMAQKTILMEIQDVCIEPVLSLKDQTELIKKQAEFIKDLANEIEQPDFRRKKHDN